MARKATPTVEDAVRQFMESRKGFAKTTRTNDAAVLNAFARGVGKDRQIGYLTAHQIEQYFLTLGAQKASSWNKTRSRIRVFLQYAQRHGWVQEDTDDLLVDVHRRKELREEKLRLSPDELVRLVNIPKDPRDRAFLAVAINSGMRGAEMSYLRLRDVDLDARTLDIFRSKTQEQDVLKITPSMERYLREWLNVYATELKDMPLDGDMFLFPKRNPPLYRGRLIPRETRGQLQPYEPIERPHHVVQRALRQLGLDTSQQGVHTLRRSTARAMFEHASEAGYDNSLRVTAALLGHESTRTTERYLGVTADRKKRDQIMAEDFLPFDKGAEVVQLRDVQ